MTGMVRRVPLVANVAGAPTPGFAAELVRVAKGVDRIDLTTTGGRLSAVQIGDRSRGPAPADGQLTLRFGDWRKTQTTSAADLFRRGLPDNLFKGQIVLVGLTSAGTSDVVHTPSGGETYGVFVQAQAVDDILRGDGPAPTGSKRRGRSGALASCWRSWPVASVTRWPIGALAATGAGVIAVARWAPSWHGFQSGLRCSDPLPVLAPAAAATAATVAALCSWKAARCRRACAPPLSTSG